MAALFVTGSSGFVGRTLLSQLASSGDDTVLALSRSDPGPSPGTVRHVRGDLLDPPSYRDALRSADTVVHLAAAVGRADRDTFFRVNLDATRRLLEECESAGVRRFLFVSSIAAGYRDTEHYPYAVSKRQAEEVVLSSRLRATIVRPTIVLGRGSAIGRRLRSLGAAPVVPVFGSGGVRVQPVHVNDVAAVIASLIGADRFSGETLELGGPDTLTMESLLCRIHVAMRGREPRVVHLPAHAIRTVLALLERISPALAPVSAGQLAVFLNDGQAKDNASTLAPGHTFARIDEMIAELIADV